ncbi:MAG TPA: hypothetical protein VJZ71_06000 [Phycisphaerae bacterium]|nr:hypothetical protein [Phycisphaerae bacterium]
MGWWRSGEGGVLGDPALDYLDELEAVGIRFEKPSDLPDHVRMGIVERYREGLGREPTEEDLKALLRFQNP